MATIEVWLRGPVHGVPELLTPVAHALLQAREDVARVTPGVPDAVLHARPGGAASPAFHLFHMAHALDRMLTYARGESLTDPQREALAMEREGVIDADAAELTHLVETTIDWAIRQLRCTPEATLGNERRVGKAAAPSCVLGLLFHAAEHTTRHTGQLITTLKILQAAGR
jgi:hypothetical protein